MKNKKLFSIGLAIVSICWIGNIIYYFSSRLDNVIFMDNYKEIGVNVYEASEESIEDDLTDTTEEEINNNIINIYVEELLLPYISDIKNEEKIVEIVFPELDNLAVYNSSEAMGSNPYIYNNLKSEYMGWNNDTLSYEDKQLILDHLGKEPITYAIYSTNLGKIYKVDLGEIYLVEASNNTGDLIESSSSSSDSDGNGDSTFYIMEDVNIVSIESNVLNEIKEAYDLYINGEHIDNVKFPIELTKGNGLEIKYKQKGNEAKSFMCNLMLKIENKEESQYVRLPMSFNNWYGLSNEIIKNIREDGNIAYEISNK